MYKQIADLVSSVYLNKQKTIPMKGKLQIHFFIKKSKVDEMTIPT
jgi:hypothetical protein